MIYYEQIVRGIVSRYKEEKKKGESDDEWI